MAGGNRAVRGWVFYDGGCGLCVGGVRWLGRVLEGYGYRVRPIQSGEAERMGVPKERLMEQMWLVSSEGRVLGGAEALVALAGRIWWMWPVRVMEKTAGGRRALRWGYGVVARNRYRVGGKRECVIRDT